MLAAYYSKGCDSRNLFQGLAISRDASFETYRNRFDVIKLDIQWLRGIAKKRLEEKKTAGMLEYIQHEVVKELKEAYPEAVKADETLIAAALADINAKTGQQFVIIIDEWDCIFREDKDDKKLQEEYITFLRGLFKGGASDEFVRLAYLTGILPIKKYGTQSALNNFRELTMTAPGGIAEYIGFTEKEVLALCEKYGVSFAKMQEWYDGYYLDKAGHIYSPNSVMEAIDNESFQNDMTTLDCADDVLTLLVHLGYLAYNSRTQEAFIPNEEVRSSFLLAVRSDGWGNVYRAIQESDRLLQATLAMDGDTVADMVEEVHQRNSSSQNRKSMISAQM